MPLLVVPQVTPRFWKLSTESELYEHKVLSDRGVRKCLAFRESSSVITAVHFICLSTVCPPMKTQILNGRSGPRGHELWKLELTFQITSVIDQVFLNPASTK